LPDADALIDVASRSFGEQQCVLVATGDDQAMNKALDSDHPNQAVADVGLIGLAVMGQNLVLNMADHGFKVAVFNRTVSKVQEFLETVAKDRETIFGARTIQEFCALIKKPRKVILLVRAGPAVDDFIEKLQPHLDPGDVIVDGGNSYYQDSTRRMKHCAEHGLLFVGCGVSGGEEGARYGPSLMPGGTEAAWPLLRPVLQAIAARADGEPCCDWVGSGGAGHFVKMVHNGIEYGDMQLISEVYDVMRRGLGLSVEECGDIFAAWNETELCSYLIEITANILKYKDDETGKPLVSLILDKAEQKGTGRWTVESSLEHSVPVTLIAEAVFSRMLSSRKAERVRASKVLQGPPAQPPLNEQDRQNMIEKLRLALYASKIVSYAQGYMLMKEAAAAEDWNLNYGGIALMWRGGCIIRSRFLGKIREAYQDEPNLENLLLYRFFRDALVAAQQSWRDAVVFAVSRGITCPAISTALAFYDGYRAETLPASLLQAQRDYFGAHTYERIDKPENQYFHTNWTGTGGTTTSNAYSA
jgi:6-phosphogluconate dehydrogenase